MVRRQKRRAVAVAFAAALLAVPVVGLGAPAGAADGGNRVAATACQQGGWQSWVRADQTSFRNPGECVAYAARGGALTTPKGPAQLLCESYGGTFAFGVDDVLWSCSDLPDVGMPEQNDRFQDLFTQCVQDGGDTLRYVNFPDLPEDDVCYDAF